MSPAWSSSPPVCYHFHVLRTWKIHPILVNIIFSTVLSIIITSSFNLFNNFFSGPSLTQIISQVRLDFYLNHAFQYILLFRRVQAWRNAKTSSSLGATLPGWGNRLTWTILGIFSIILTLVLNIRMISAINIRGRQLLYHDITDNCWGYTQAPNNEC